MLHCWVVTDGRAGIENQALGLAEAVGRRVALEITTKRIRIGEPWRSLPGAVWGDPLERLSKDGALLRPPYPELLIACGRLAAPVAAAVKQKHPRTFVVQLQTPPVAAAAFDLVIPPEHDRRAGANVFPILGAPHRATRARIEADAALLAETPDIARLPAPRVAVLLGGPNRAYRFGAA
ncbi:MAG: mitochondrial fission ELM1 family protein, partial [Parvularculaceae bacterium]|nr:mitochondrial fission ELM1 family protein [Parvularculaceae bacterium]